MREDIQELVEDLMERCKWVKEEVQTLGVEETDAEHVSRSRRGLETISKNIALILTHLGVQAEALKTLDAELHQANQEYMDAVAESGTYEGQDSELERPIIDRYALW